MADGTGVFLDQLDPIELELPPSSLATMPGSAIPIQTPFRYTGTTKKGLHQWVTPLPVRPRGLFFHKEEPGMVLSLNHKALSYSRFGPANPMAWIHDRYDLIVYTSDKTAPPTDGSLSLTWPLAQDRSEALNFDASGANPETFHRASVTSEWDQRRGLLLPAPGKVTYEVDVPPAGELLLAPGVVPAEIAGSVSSDGATVRVRVKADGDWEELASLPAEVGAFPQRHVDLSAFAGKRVELQLVSDPCPEPCEGPKNAEQDYVFIAAPLIASRRSKARRVVMVFIDTLRPDHMSMYGYERHTTAPLDTAFANAAIFTEARSVAPWTLPSARSVLTGRQPEDWSSAIPLPQVFHNRGEPTAFFAGNIYLSTQFGLDRGWDLHRVELWPSADSVTDQALDWLAENEGHGGLLQVHYMDPHLPYLEPPSHRGLYAADTVPDGLREQFHLSDMRKVGDQLPEESVQWIRDRYDNNIRYTADAVARLLGALDPDDIVVLYADHGEEFFEHTGFEHGHTLFDELLRVPLVIRAPGMPAGRYDTPVSLLDITPTILDLIDAELPDLDGMSLVPLANKDSAATGVFDGRVVGFGRVLYGGERWGLIDGDQKYLTTNGREAVFDLTKDPGETKNMALRAPEVSAPFRARLGEAVDHEVAVGWRWAPTNAKPKDSEPLEAICSFPGGIERGVASVDPLGNGTAKFKEIDAKEARDTIAAWEAADPNHVIEDDQTHVFMKWTGTKGREVVLVPNEPLESIGHQVRCTARWCTPLKGVRPCPTAEFHIAANRDPGFGPVRTGLASAAWGTKRQLIWGLGILPIPVEGTSIDATNPEMTDALRSIGYFEEEEGE